MASDGAEKQPSTTVPQPKRRRLRGACDICRKQKARCDSAEMPGNRCSNCIAFQSECTHSRTFKGYSSSTDAQSNIIDPSRTVQDHITSILSGSSEYVSGDPIVVYKILVAVAQYARRLEEALTTGPGSQWSPSPGSLPSTGDGADTNSDDNGVLVDFNLSEPLQRITRDLSSNRFYGKSSSLNFVKAVMDAKKEVSGDANMKLPPQRPEFWNIRAWEITSEIFVPHLFPENDLMKTLIDNFFMQINTITYILHAPTFRRAVAASLHLYDQKFGAVVLAICALGAKFSDDPRVFMEGTHSEHSAGWKWFRQVRPIPTSFVFAPSLYEIQLVCLSMLYLASGSTPEQCWTLVGVGVRMCYDVGAHRRIRSHGDTIESESYKRIFWLLLCSDTIMSSLLGRPRSAPMHELDIDLPVALEGEEPIGEVYGSLLVKLMEIWGRVQDAIYPTKRKEQNYQEIVVDLDSALNQWVDSVPDELRWDPNRLDLIRLNQSACLYATCYHVQILLHRPFIPSSRNLSSLSSITFPSLAICANAARSCGHVMSVQATRGAGPLYNPQIISTLFDSAVVLLLNVFHRSPPSADQSIQKCLKVLRLYERRWQTAGRNADIIAGMLDIEGPTILPSLKRTRSSEGFSPSSSEAIRDGFEEPRNVAGSNRVTAVTQEIEQLQVSEQEIERLLFLPLRTEDLGRLPVYESFDFDSIFHPDVFAESVGSTALDVPFSDGLGLDSTAPFENSWDDWSTYGPH
ncbi:fungal-specific transcription factor domain-containing protein [Mycena epipterygia]|nr:fungal-specific transcription factor domain-containing protein [Mycena epipterygia]